MRSPAIRLLLSFCFLLTAPVLFAHSVTVSGTVSFASLDGSADDHDGSANGVFTVSDGDLIVNGTISCNDDPPKNGNDSACAMSFNISRDLVVNAGGSLVAENLRGSGTGGNITLTVGRHLILRGPSAGLAGALVSSGSPSTGNTNAGNITATVSGTTTFEAGSTVSAASKGALAGSIQVTSSGPVDVSGLVASGPSRTVLATKLTGDVLDGGSGQQQGGQITIRSTGFVEPGVSVGSNAVVVSQGEANGAGPVTIEGCGVSVTGLVAALAKKDSPARVVIRSGKGLVIDAQDLGAPTPNAGRVARIRADASDDGAVDKKVDIFANEAIQVLGPTGVGTLYAVSTTPGTKDKKDGGGTITVISLNSSVTASGRVFTAGLNEKKNKGGTVVISSQGNANLSLAQISAVGDYSDLKKAAAGGKITVRSHSGNINWTNGIGDVRPVGSDAPASAQGSIVLTACGTVTTSGTSFPTNGAPVGPFPTVQTGVCSPASPSLPIGEPALQVCNTPPTANDTTASTNEDTSVTITLTASDPDGDTLTFSIVSGPSNGSLGPIIPTGPTSAQVTYSPNLNYNGSDAFVFKVDDGNGGSDTGNVSITIAPVNDPPTFQAGPNQSSLEDGGPQTVFPWATSISPGPADENGQTVTFQVTGNSNPSLFSAGPAVAPNGTLTYTAAANAYGSATITIVAKDNGGTASGGNDTSAPQSFTITIQPVNDAPSFTAGPNQSVSEDAGPQTVPGWATAISPGPNESGQVVTFQVTGNSNPSLFSAGPAVDSAGTLTYTPAANANGTATITLVAKDDGGIANGGVDTSAPQSFTISIGAVNDPPSFTGGGNVTVLEDSGAYSATWATSISAGPPDESGQTVTFTTSNDNNALFSVQPAISPSGVLVFTPAEDAYGSANVTVTATDNGGGSDTSAPQTFVITVTPVNDAPSFTAGGNVTVAEDSGAYSAAWASSISAGPNEGTQTVSFNVSNDNNGLFSVQPSISPSGVLTFTPAANANGSAVVTVSLSDNGGVANGGVDTSASVTFTITVTAVNDPPSFTGGGNVTVNEDSGSYSATWATSISSGPPDESGQTVSFNVSNDNNALFSVQPSISPSGVLTFTPAADAFGSANVTVTLTDNGGGADTSAPQTFVITVNAVNDAPSFTPGGNVTVNEDSGSYSAAWASSISAGPNEGGQTVSFNVSNDNNGLFSVQPSISPSGVLSFTPAANANGSATVTVSLSDNGGTAFGGVDTSASVTFTITINAVNDAPSFTPGGNVSVAEDSGSYSQTWATGISAGPPDEAGQTVAFTVSNDNNGLFSVQPSISPSGVLTFTVAAEASGSANVSVFLTDNGGVAFGGVDTSATVVFTITVTAVNDPPVNTVPGAQTINEDTTLVFAGPTAISVSDPDAGAAAIQVTLTATNGTLTLNGTAGLVFLVGDGSADPTMTFTGSQATINARLNGSSYTPAANYFGLATVTITTNDLGNTGSGGPHTDTDPINITVNAVNDGPVAGNDSWQTIGNTEIRVDLPPGVTPHVSDTTTSGRGVLDNDADPGEGDPIVVTGVVGCADVVAPYDCTLPSGAVLSLQANGNFSFTPGPGSTSDSFQYTVTDVPSFGSPVSATGTVTFTMLDMVWYVNGSAALAGNGTSIAPYQNFTSLNGAGGVGDVDGAGHYIFVHSSTINSASIELEASQHLLGEGVGLSLSHNLNGNGSPTNLVAAGVQPLVNNSTDVVRATAALPIEIRGLSLGSTTGNAVDVTATGAYSGSSSLTISNNTIRNAGTEGVDINAGATGTAAVSVSQNTWSLIGPHTGNAIDARTTLGTLNLDVSNNTDVVSAATGILIDGAGGGSLVITGLGSNSVHGNTALTGIAVNKAHFDSIPGGISNIVNLGNTTVGSVGNGVGTSGVLLINVSGGATFNDLDIVNDAGTGLRVIGVGAWNDAGTAGTYLSSLSGGGTIASAGGPAVDFDNMSTIVQFASIASTNSPTTGASFVNVFDTSGQQSVFTAAGGAITNALGTDFNVTNGNADITYGGTITDDVGQLVNVSGTTGGTKSFTGAITDGNDGDGNGVSLTSNPGAAISFSGGLTLSTGANPAFTATGGGTVTVCDENPCNPGAAGALVNQITTTTATALNVANTSIGANNLEFRSITAGTAASSSGVGISLDNTGTSGTNGGLVVRGTGAAGSGGTIQRKSGADGSTTGGIGIYLNVTKNASFDWMQLNDFDNFAIRGTTVHGFTLNHSTINGVNGNNDGADEAAIRFENLLVSGLIDNSTIAGSVETNIRVINNTGTLNALVIQNSTIRSNSATTGGDGIFARAQTGATMTVKVLNCILHTHRDDHIQTDAENSGVMNSVITGNTLTSNGIIGAPPLASTLGGHITVTGGAAFSSTSTFNISNNNITGAVTAPITVSVTSTTSTGTGLLSGTISNNQLGQAGSANSGSSTSDGMSVIVNGASTINATITGNSIRQFNNIGMQFVKRDGTGNMNLTVTGNSVAEPVAPNALQGILLTSGATSGPPADSGTVCADIGGSGALMNAVTGPNFGGDLIRVRQRFATIVRLPGYAGGATNTAAVATYLIGRNNITNEAPNAKASATTQAPGSFTSPGGGACTAGANPN